MTVEGKRSRPKVTGYVCRSLTLFPESQEGTSEPLTVLARPESPRGVPPRTRPPPWPRAVGPQGSRAERQPRQVRFGAPGLLCLSHRTRPGGRAEESVPYPPVPVVSSHRRSGLKCPHSRGSGDTNPTPFLMFSPPPGITVKGFFRL